jgi:voltage-gated potassium channel
MRKTADGLRRHRFLALLLALGGLVVVYPLLHEALTGRVLFNVLRTLLFLAALLVLFPQRSLRLLALVLGIPTILAGWTGYALPGLPPLALTVAFHACAALFLALVVATMLRGLSRARAVTAESIYAALGVYLLVGVAFGHLYCVVESLNPRAFRMTDEVAGQLQDAESRHFVFIYYSLITLTTLGYGDIVPVSGPARGLSVVEAVIGQFYVAVLIAGLVSKRASGGASGGPPDPDQGGDRGATHSAGPGSGVR